MSSISAIFYFSLKKKLGNESVLVLVHGFMIECICFYTLRNSHYQEE